MKREAKKTKGLNLWLVGLMAFFALFGLSCAGDDDDGLFSSLNAPELDANYWDHGMVNVTGNTVTTKVYSMLPDAWRSNSKIHKGPGGVRIDDYMFYFDTKSPSVLTVRNITSGITKDLSKKAAYYRGIIMAELLMGRDIWTVLRGFTKNGTDEYGEPAYKVSYRLISRSGYGTMKYFEVNVIEAFEQGNELALESIANVQFPTHDGLISLIRVPSLEPNPQSENFGCNDFAAVVYANHNEVRWLNTRYIQFDPSLVDLNQPSHAWVYQPVCKYETFATFGPKVKTKWIGIISNISATLKIDSNGRYCVAIAVTCRDRFKTVNGYFSFVGSTLETYAVTYDFVSKKYGLQHVLENRDLIWVNYRGINRFLPTFDNSHGTIIATYAKGIDGENEAKQILSFIGYRKIGEGTKDEYEALWIYDRVTFVPSAVYDWSESELSKYGIAPEVMINTADKRAGEGSIVQGMVLSVPPNKAYSDVIKPIGEEVDKYASVKFTNTITSTLTTGTKTTTGAGIDFQLGAIAGVFPAAYTASAAWSYTKGTTKTTTLKYRSDWWLQDCRGNLVITLDPNITLKSAVLSGIDAHGGRYNVRYHGQPETGKAYAITTAVMGERIVFNYRYGITDQPGYDLNSQKDAPLKPLVLTQGMTLYRVDQIRVDGEGPYTSYNRIIDSLKYFSGAGAGKIIPVIAMGNTFVGSDAGVSSEVEISEKLTTTTEATQSWSGSMSAGKEAIVSMKVTVNGEFCVSVSNSKEDKVGWIVAYIKELTNKGVFKVLPDVFWIPVSKLKAKYGTRKPEGLPENRDLEFIPDYMWNNDMNYWLLAYTDIRVEEF